MVMFKRVMNILISFVILFLTILFGYLIMVHGWGLTVHSWGWIIFGWFWSLVLGLNTAFSILRAIRNE